MQEKLRRVLAEQLEDEGVVDHPICPSTLQRMIREYLESRNCEISFTQSDHNACPICKTLSYAILQFRKEKKVLAAKKMVLQNHPLPFTKSAQKSFDKISEALEAKEYQDSTFLIVPKEHAARGALIRRFLKTLTDYFRIVENKYRQMGENAPFGWRQRPDHAIITHQDDMSK